MKAAMFTSGISLVTVKIIWGFRDKKPRLIFQTGGLRVSAFSSEQTVVILE